MEKHTITYPLADEKKLTLTADVFDMPAAFAGLAALCGLPLDNENGNNAEFHLSCNTCRELPDLFRLRHNKRSDIYWDHETLSVRYITDTIPAAVSDAGVSAFWRFCLTLGAIAAIIREKPLAILHCSLLETPGGALIICGESGMGKSTTARRFREAGGRCTSDDMIMIEERSDGFYAYPLPTWSACAQQIEGRSYPFVPIKVKDVFFLTRGENQEEIRQISAASLQAQLYRGLFFHMYAWVKLFPEELQMKVMKYLRDLSSDMTSTFTPKALFAHLDGDLRKTLKDYL